MKLKNNIIFKTHIITSSDLHYNYIATSITKIINHKKNMFLQNMIKISKYKNKAILLSCHWRVACKICVTLLLLISFLTKKNIHRGPSYNACIFIKMLIADEVIMVKWHLSERINACYFWKLLQFFFRLSLSRHRRLWLKGEKQIFLLCQVKSIQCSCSTFR